MFSYSDELRCEVEAALDDATMFDNHCPDRLREAIRYSLLAKGKRLRPVLLLAACELCDGDRQLAMPVACAVEMVHCYSLIHDDLPSMDNDDLRRGILTCHKKFDEPTAILSGDALLALAFEMVGNLTPTLGGLCCKELAVAAGPCWLVGGQMDDIIHEKRLDGQTGCTIEDIERIHHRKTGALIRGSLRLGAIVAGASPTQLAALDQFGTNFGLAFQITDDILDVLGDEQVVGKRLRKDEGMDKWSYPRLLGIEAAKQEAKRAVAEAEKSLHPFVSKTKPFDLLCEMTKQLPTRIA
jgi:geranylgeranyl diphosphate synthase type II